MPSHPDRVRRNYHEIYVGKKDDFLTNEEIITVRISKISILASAMSRQEVWHNIVRSIKNGILDFKLNQRS